MTYLTEDMLADFSDPMAFAMRSARPSHPFQRTSCLKSYAEAGRAPLVDTPAWDPDEPISGALEDF